MHGDFFCVSPVQMYYFILLHCLREPETQAFHVVALIVVNMAKNILKNSHILCLINMYLTIMHLRLTTVLPIFFYKYWNLMNTRIVCRI